MVPLKLWRVNFPAFLLTVDAARAEFGAMAEAEI